MEDLDIFKPKEEPKYNVNLYYVDCGTVNYNKYQVEYERDKRYTDGYSLTNYANYVYTDLYAAIKAARAYTEESCRYAIISMFEREVNEYDIYYMLRRSDKDLAFELSQIKPDVSRVIYSVHRFSKNLYFNFIKGGKMLIKER